MITRDPTERLYRFFLRYRPVLQRWAARLDRPGTPR
jgi:hypothetical protein